MNFRWGNRLKMKMWSTFFDFEENDITHDIQQQRDFYNHWITSLAE
jgi:hypothetical protein